MLKEEIEMLLNELFTEFPQSFKTTNEVGNWYVKLSGNQSLYLYQGFDMLLNYDFKTNKVVFQSLNNEKQKEAFEITILWLKVNKKLTKTCIG